MAPRLRGRVQLRHAFGLVRVVLRRPGAAEAAILLPEAVDFFLGDQPLDRAERVGRVFQHSFRPFGILVDALAGEALADVDAAGHGAAAARARPMAKLLGLQHHGLDALLVQFERGGKPAIAGANDGDARCSRHLDQLAGGRAIGLPPIGCGREIAVKNVAVAHRPRLSERSARHRPDARTIPRRRSAEPSSARSAATTNRRQSS